MSLDIYIILKKGEIAKRGGHTHYKCNGKVYKSKKSLLRVMELEEMLKQN